MKSPGIRQQLDTRSSSSWTGKGLKSKKDNRTVKSLHLCWEITFEKKK